MKHTKTFEPGSYARSKFLPRKPYSRAGWRNKEKMLCEVTFADGFVARAYALRDMNADAQTIDIGRPARAAIEKWRLDAFPEIGIAAYSEPVPDIIELRSLECGSLYDVNLANANTITMREAKC